MKNALFNIIKDVTEATISKNIIWTEIENSYCLKGVFQNKTLIICQYRHMSSKKLIASFNFLDNNQDIIEPLNDWEENEEGFDLVSNLYIKASEQIPAYS